MRDTAMSADRTSVTVVPLDAVVDPENEETVEAELRALQAGAGVVVVHVRTRVVTPRALHLLLRARQRAAAEGGILCVAAPDPAARRIFHLTGLSRVLRVAATVPGAVRRNAGAGCGHPPAATPAGARVTSPLRRTGPPRPRQVRPLGRFSRARDSRRP
ncbi:anti-anti-sigma factor [Streptomyces griseus]|uniref:Anti-anti-sigma factor n=2 Tax=Streptomyces TaxID=1883 RepID=A0A380P451_STRGR|nr:anti-anti-sigma factor [Streptomyces griseus]